MPSEPTWRLTAAGIVAIVAVTVTGWSEVSEKAERKEVETLAARVSEAETAIKLSNQNQAWILQDVKKANEKLDYIIMEMSRIRDPGSMQPPRSTPSPLNR
jgi:hypothetical protein